MGAKFYISFLIGKIWLYKQFYGAPTVAYILLEWYQYITYVVGVFSVSLQKEKWY